MSPKGRTGGESAPQRAGAAVSPASGRALSIDAGQPQDAAALAAMIRALAEYERLTHMCVGTEDDLQRAIWGPDPAAEVLIARLDDVPVGFALFFHTFSTFLARRGLWLEDLFVYPEHRGAGIGKALLRAVATVARDRGCGRFEWSVLDWNAPALRFYESLGATIMPDWRIARVAGPAIQILAGNDDRPAGAGTPARPIGWLSVPPGADG
jgi:GNAT superfamily N-acetyltransferase